MIRTVAYIRVSSTDQSENGHSLGAQREKCELYAKLHGVSLAAIIEDAGVSAKTLDRPGLQRALAMLKAGEADALLVTKLDRLTRSVKDLGHLIESYFPADTGKPALLSVSDQIDTRTAGGRLVLNVLMSVAQWEREAIAERTKDTMRSMRANGRVIGRPTMGFDEVEGADGKRMLVANETEQAIIARILAMRGDGVSYQRIADTLNAEKVPTKRGGAWAAMTVRGIAQRA